MPFLLDTCLLSEIWKPSPNRGVLKWLAQADEEELFFSVLTLGEIRRGVERLPVGRRRDGLARDLVRLRGRFAGRIVAVTETTAERWGELSAMAAHKGHTLHVVDGLLAATAIVHGLTLATRNVRDFTGIPVPLLNPWA